MPGSYESLAAHILQPAARGSLQCFCHGEVVEMRSQYGWLKVDGDIDHPFAEKHDGHVFVHKQDVAKGKLATGDRVSFYLYVDEKGLGAELCKVDSEEGWNDDDWHGKSSWGYQQQHQYTSQHQQPNAVYYMQVGFVMSPTSGTQTHSRSCPPPPKQQSVADQIAAEEQAMIDAGELPSVGSVGHADGSCKRCAFFPKGRCQNGKDCTHCHFDHSARMRLRKRKQCRRGVQYKDAEEDAPLQEEEEEEEPETLATDDNANVDRQDTDDTVDETTSIADAVVHAPAVVFVNVPTGKDCPSEDDIVEVATMAPSSSSFSDDDGYASPCRASDVSPCLTPAQSEKLPFSDGSDSDSASSNGCTPKSSDQELSKPAARKLSNEFGTSPTSWSAQLRRTRASRFCNNQDVSTESIAKKTRALLNKLTEERFEKLCGQIEALPISTPEQLGVVAAEIFEKATTQDGFRSLYTELCMRLDAHFAKDSAIGGKCFRKALANACQATFERNLQPADPALFVDLNEEECFEVEMKLKTRRLGNMRFMGELMERRLLAQKLMPGVVLELLQGDEAALESLVAFLTVVAPFFEKQSSLYQAPMRDAFSALRRKMKDTKTSSRLRCHLNDMFDAQKRGWVARSV